jgi:hypothetical protein
MPGMFGFGELFIVGLFGLVPVILLVIAMVDILRNNFQGYDKVVWVLVVIFIPFIGSILYLTIGKNQKISA